jgi:CheY-specific phosphatase CheX
VITPNADVVNAFVTALARVLRTSLGEPARFTSLHVSRELEPAPSVAVSVELTGSLRGPVMWVFSPEIARILATRMMMSEQVPAECVADAVAELSNIVTGNATGPLHDAGFDVELAPPVIFDSTTRPALLNDTLVATVAAASGTVRVYLGVEVAVEVAA